MTFLYSITYGSLSYPTYCFATSNIAAVTTVDAAANTGLGERDLVSVALAIIALNSAAVLTLSRWRIAIKLNKSGSDSEVS